MAFLGAQQSRHREEDGHVPGWVHHYQHRDGNLTKHPGTHISER